MDGHKRILVVDDDEQVRSLIELTLTTEGYEVLTADNGKDALLLALREKLDLILLDVMMPFVDGYHVAKQLSTQNDPKPPPIVIITARQDPAERKNMLDSGAIDIIHKPINYTQFIERVREILSQPS